MKKLGTAIIGCGNICKVHADAVLNNDDTKLISVVDIVEDKAKSTSEKYDCTYYTDYEEMLKNNDIDVVHICTPHYLHAQMAIKAVQCGKNVLIEKPVAINVKQAQKIIEATKNSGKHIGVCFQNRLNPTSIKAKQLIDDNKLGKVKGIKALVTWHRDEAYYAQGEWRGKFKTEGGGVLINQAIHTLDLMQWFGGKINKIKGNVDTRLLDNVIEVEDTADATLYFENGTVGIFYATNCYTTNSSVEIELHCENGLITIKDGKLIVTQDKKSRVLIDENGEVSKYKSYWGVSHKKLINDFYKCILTNNTKNYVSLEEGIKTLKMLEGIYKSSKTRMKIDL